MPKLTGPLFSVEAHGALADALTFQRRPGGAAVYPYKKPKIPLTDRQLWQRNLIRWCVYEWQNLSDGEKAEWEAKALGQGQSGYSYFIRQKRGYLFDPDVALYLPLYDERLKADNFLSMESYGHPCSVVNATWGALGRTFAGNGYINCGANGVFDLTTGITIEVWFKRTGGAGAYRMLLSKKETAYELGIDSSNRLFFQANRGAVTTGACWATALSLNIWYHASFTFSSTVLGPLGQYHTLYINGVPKALTWLWGSSDSNTILSTNALNVNIGRRSGSTLYFIGIIGESGLNVDSLSPSKIEHDYLATKWRYQ